MRSIDPPSCPRSLVLPLLACALVSACDSNTGTEGAQQPRTVSVAGFNLLPLPRDRLKECRKFAALARGATCPRFFPRPRHGRVGSWYVKPVKAGLGPDEPRVGIDITYLPDLVDEPASGLLVHFTLSTVSQQSELVGYGAELPRTARPAKLGGRSGVYAPPTGPTPCCNHAIFVWSEGGRRYAASLHGVGLATKRLLDAILDHYAAPAPGHRGRPAAATLEAAGLHE